MYIIHTGVCPLIYLLVLWALWLSRLIRCYSILWFKEIFMLLTTLPKSSEFYFWTVTLTVDFSSSFPQSPWHLCAAKFSQQPSTWSRGSLMRENYMSASSILVHRAIIIIPLLKMNQLDYSMKFWKSCQSPSLIDVDICSLLRRCAVPPLCLRYMRKF